MNESQWDHLLHIKTTGRDDSHSDQYKYPYEPTPYSVLERLANSSYIRKKQVLIDYGCGKGRVDFFLSYQTRCRSIGIEYDDHIYEAACENLKTCISKDKVTILHTDAEKYVVPEDVDHCFFFNPFSIEILKKVMKQVLVSYYEAPRDIYLYFYYPQSEYIAYLMTVDELEFVDEIDCKDLFDGNDEREVIMVFKTI